MQKSINPFESLRCPGIPDSDVIRTNYKTITVFSDRTESVQILVADGGNNRWAFGYNINFADGRRANRLPCLEMGYCTSEQNAILYFLGYILKYNSMFSDNVIHEMNRLIAVYSQPSLF